MARAETADLVGREDELARLEAAAGGAQDGRGGRLLLTGEPGGGETHPLAPAAGRGGGPRALLPSPASGGRGRLPSPRRPLVGGAPSAHSSSTGRASRSRTSWRAGRSSRPGRTSTLRTAAGLLRSSSNSPAWVSCPPTSLARGSST